MRGPRVETQQVHGKVGAGVDKTTLDSKKETAVVVIIRNMTALEIPSLCVSRHVIHLATPDSIGPLVPTT